MSKATKRKHVTREVLEDYILPDGNQQILKIVGGRGNNLHEAQTSVGERFLISMPTRFRKNVWIKRGDYVLADPITEGDKVKGEIVAILYPKQIKYIKEEKLWPEGFDATSCYNAGSKDPDSMMEELTRTLQDAAISDEVSISESHNQDNISNLKDHNSANNGGLSGNDAECHSHVDDSEDDYSSENNDDDLFINTNRPTVTYFYSDSSEEEEEEGSEEEEEGSEEEEEGEEKEKVGYEHGSDGSADR